MSKRKVVFCKTLAELSQFWCDVNHIPEGMYLTLINLRGTKRQIRSDKKVSLHTKPYKSEDEVSLNKALTTLEKCFVENLRQEGLKLSLCNSNRSNVHGSKLMSSIRSQSLNDQNSNIEHIRDLFSGPIRGMIHGDGFEDVDVARAALQAMLKELGKNIVFRALEAEVLIEEG